MPNHIRRITRWLAAPLALFIVRRPYLRTEEIRAALDGIKHDDTKQREALAALAGLAPQLQALLKAAGVPQ